MPERMIGLGVREAGWWPWIWRTFQALLRKLLDAHQKKATKEQLLSIVDFWIGQLYLVRSAIEAGQFPAVMEKPKEEKVAVKPRARRR